MKKILKSKTILAAAFASALGFAGCNIFNPTDNVRIDSDDAAALTYQGYLHYQKNEYSKAREYFEQAIAADSSYSEAWYGRAKAVLSMQSGLNLFQLISYAKVDEGENATSKFMNMPDEEANNIKSAIDSVCFYLDPFIELDTLGKTDKKVTFKSFANSYTILQMTKLALTVRSANLDLQNLFSTDLSSGNMSVNWAALDPDSLGESVQETFTALAATAQTLKKNPEQTNKIIREYVPGAEMFSDTALTLASEVMSNQIIAIADIVNDPSSDRASVFLRVGNHMDDDGDGCVDEEVFDGFDNDGDGEIDEDLRENETTIREENLFKHSPMQVKEVVLTDSYKTVDIDGDGVNGPDDPKEYTFVIAESNERDNQQNHLFVYAANFSWYTTDVNDLIANKELARHDTDVNNIKYDLDWRKANIGGCWNNYDDTRFLKWFEGRN